MVNVASLRGEPEVSEKNVVCVSSDDEASIRSFLSRRLEAWGYVAREARDANQALEMMLADPASIAIIDIRMPGRDGLWLTRQIRRRWTKTAIIIANGGGRYRLN